MIFKYFCGFTAATGLLFLGVAGSSPANAQASILDVLRKSQAVQESVVEAARRAGSTTDSCHWTLMVEPNEARVQCFGPPVPPALPGDEEYPNCDVAISFHSGKDHQAVQVDRTQVICNEYVGCLELDVNMNCGKRAGTD